MANENETMMDVCSEWRECIEAADPSVWDDERIAGLVKTTKAQQLAYLDRIEATWKREREELDKRISDLESYAKLWTGRADELRLKCDEFYAKAKPVGNAAAMREALEAIVSEAVRLSKMYTVYTAPMAHLTSIATDALAAPPRNCDVYDPDKAAHMMEVDYCGSMTPSHCDGTNCTRCSFKWFTSPAEKGGAK